MIEQLLSQHVQIAEKDLLSTDRQNLEEDLNLLIRAHDKIRQLQEENFNLSLDVEKLSKELSTTVQNNQILTREKQNILLTNGHLLKKIEKLQQIIGSRSLCTNFNQPQCKDQSKDCLKQQLQLKPLNNFQSNQHSQSTQEKKSALRRNLSSHTLKQSESTPVIVNLNVNLCSKEQKQQFLQSCKEDFDQQITKLKSYKNHSLHNTECLFADQEKTFPKNSLKDCTPTTSEYGVTDFLIKAKKQFENQHSKTIKTIQVDRKKCSSTNSFTRKNDAYQFRKQTSDSKQLFRDRTNIFNSKQASVSQIINNTAKTFFGQKTSSNMLKLNSTSQHSVYKNPCSIASKTAPGNNAEERVSNVLKKSNKSIYFKKQRQCNDDYWQANIKQVKNRKLKQYQLQLQNCNYGIIKYRGLCV